MREVNILLWGSLELITLYYRSYILILRVNCKAIYAGYTCDSMSKL